jgi:hypothetical protein
VLSDAFTLYDIEAGKARLRLQSAKRQEERYHEEHLEFLMANTSAWIPGSRDADKGKFLDAIAQGIWMKPVGTISPSLLAVSNQRLTEIGRA